MDQDRDNYIGMMLDNRYEILEKVGEGGMALVYKARCHRLNRFVAVKILRPEYAKDEEFRRRFHTESQAVAMLSHPNIVAVYDVNRSQGVEYLVMELIDGITLKQYMSRKGKLNWREALHFTTQIVRALSHAHGRGIIHRDIKPHNIMVLRDGSVKVADFGIARIASQSTLTQEALGSVHYISPEQAKGGVVDARSDIYSVGVMLYEMLTGKLPFEGDNAVAIAIQHISSVPLSPRDIEPSIPVGLEEITMKAMAADLRVRYASADEMYADLESFRKNPEMTFGYRDELSAVLSSDEPTQALPRVISGRSRREASKPQHSSALSSRHGHGSVQRRQREDGSAVSSRTARIARTTQTARRTRSDRRSDYRYEEKRGQGGTVAMVFAVLMVLAVVGVLLYFVWQIVSPIFFPEDNDLRVPNLVGEIYDEVVANPEDYKADGFTIELDPVMAYGDEPAGTIIEQSPDAGRTVSQSSAVITVTVSRGERSIELEDFAGDDYRTAEIRLTRLNLLVDFSYETSEDVLSGNVIRTEPQAGSLLGEGETVVLVVSTGPDVVKVEMPNLVGSTEEYAKSVLAKNKLNFGNSTPKESLSEAGTVIWQSVQAGMMIDEGTVIDIQVSSGPAVTATPTPTPTPTSEVTETPAPPGPSDTPTSTPSGGTVTDPPLMKIVTHTIRLPSDREQVKVTVMSDGVKVYDQTVATSQQRIDVQLTGVDSIYVEIYFDGELVEAGEVEIP